MDLVNATAKARLSPQNSEPSHIAGKNPYTDIGGTGVADQPNSVKINAAAGVGTDTTIPKSVPAEGSHLDTVNNSVASKANADVDVSFDDEPVNESDDLDKALDQFEDVKPVDVEVDMDDDEDKKLKEDFPDNFKKKDGDDDKEKKGNPFAKKDDDGDDDKKDKKDGPTIIVKEGDVEGNRGDNNGKTAASFGPIKAANAQGGNKTPLPEEDENPFAKKDDKAVSESVKVHIKLPNLNTAALFEEAGVPAASQKRMAVLFESAVKDVSKQVSKQVSSHYAKLNEQNIANYKRVMGKQVDAYLNYVIEEWISGNKVAVRQTLRTQMAESLMDGLKALFLEHHVDIPQSKVDVVKKLTEDVAKLKKSLNEQTEQKMKLRRLAEAANKARIVAQFVRGANLSEQQIVKLEKFAEDVNYTTAAEFREKLTMLRESYFPAGKKELVHLPEEAIVVTEEKKAKATNADPLIAATLAASKQMNDADKW